MRLINTATGQFREFIGDVPQYAILSHTWGDEEVSFKEMNDGANENKKGFEKIKMTCQMAAIEGLQYAWVDTCCIDKSSSAELTEAINSMYRWYQRSAVCYAFLSDLPGNEASTGALPTCRWFTRGWTLQELLAPSEVIFFNQNWERIGSKATLAPLLSEITAIDVRVLQMSHRYPLASIPAATKMSWAARRHTTRIEDQAYSLLGLFNVHMPLLYGEERQAFRRLQEEIIKTTPDLSIFGWSLPPGDYRPWDTSTRLLCGILANSATAFAGCRFFGLKLTHNVAEFSVSNNGVKTRLQLRSRLIPGSRGLGYVLPLDYRVDNGKSLGIKLRKVGPDQFLREDPWAIFIYGENLVPGPPRERFFFTRLPRVATSPFPFTQMDAVMGKMRTHALRIHLPMDVHIYDAWSWGRYDNEDELFFVSGDSQPDCAILRLFGSVNVQHLGVTGRFQYEFVFCSVGWSTTHLQCTLIDSKAYAKEINEARDRIEAWDHGRYQVITAFINQKIPKSQVAAIEIPHTGHYVLVSYSAKLTSQPSICSTHFWMVQISCRTVASFNLPTSYENWIVM